MRSGPSNPATWLEYAADDLRVARLCIDAAPPSVRNACFHAQQCVEKYLKAFLTAQGIQPPKIHDLDALLAKCLNVDKSLASLSTACDTLNSLLEPARYPSEDVPVPSIEQAKSAVALAAHVEETLLAKLR